MLWTNSFGHLEQIDNNSCKHSYSSRSIKQEVGYYLHREGPNLGKHCVPRLLLPSTLDAQFGTPYPRSAGFDTDIGALIESSSVSTPLGPMAPLIIKNDAVQVRLFSPDRSSYSAALHYGLIRLAIWSRSEATPLAIRSDLEV